jgi:hypothetical protein
LTRLRTFDATITRPPARVIVTMGRIVLRRIGRIVGSPTSARDDGHYLVPQVVL